MALFQFAHEQQAGCTRSAKVSSAPMPKIGQSEAHYVALVQAADLAGDQFAHAAAKVGQYVTLALDPKLPWEEKARCFHHTYKHHCTPPPYASPQVREDYAKLADLVRHHAGQEALRFGRAENAELRRQRAAKVDRWHVKREAIAYFSRFSSLLGQCPEWMQREAWMELIELRASWS
jgi:hypothetical protein